MVKKSTLPAKDKSSWWERIPDSLKVLAGIIGGVAASLGAWNKIEPYIWPPMVLGSRVVLLDGFQNFDASGFNFAKGTIVDWGDLSGDIGVARLTSQPLASFYAPANGPDDPNSKAGISIAPDQRLFSIKDCRTAKKWNYGYYEPTLQTVYCIRTRDGLGYGKIEPAEIDAGEIIFDWTYQPNPKFSF